MKALEAIDRWIFKTYEPCTGGLPLFRILFSVYLLVFHLPRYAWLAEMPHAFFQPPISLAMFFSGLPPGWFFYVLDFLLELGALCLLFGIRTRFVSFAMFIALIVGNSFRYSIGGKIDHDILTPATLFCFAFTGWGNRLSRDDLCPPRSPRRNSPSWPIAFFLLIIGVCMFSAAYPKALTGWLNPHVCACRGQMIANNLLNVRPMPLADILLQIHSTLFWKGADYSTLAIEGGFLFCLVSLPATRLIATFATFFHVFVYFSMDIFFASNLAAYACLVDFRVLLLKLRMRRLVRRFHWLAHRISLFHLVLLALALLGFSALGHYWETEFFRIPDNLGAVIALAIALTSLFYFLGAFADRSGLICTHKKPAL
jgi:uncharacterized membrane protein YphA (DoxX/SURF4 family)